jgi:hypothetical protein
LRWLLAAPTAEERKLHQQAAPPHQGKLIFDETPKHGFIDR